MAEMISCKICGRFFESTGFLSVCSVCKIKDDEIYGKLREYLIQHPRSKIFDVSRELDIPVYYIKRYLREERLEIVEKENSFLTCEKCGSPIRSGRTCKSCVSEPVANRNWNEVAMGQRGLQSSSGQDQRSSSQKIKYMSGR